MNVVLLFPPTANPAPSYFGPPYGLALLGALLEGASHRVAAYDYDRGSVAAMLADLERMVREDRPELVGISCLSVNRGPAELAVRKLKAIAPNVPIILGGPFPTLEPELMLRRTPAELVCVGDGDETLLEVVDALGSGRDLARVPGLALRVDGAIRRTPERGRFSDLDTLPFPKLDLFPVREMLERHRLPEDRAQMQRISASGRTPFVTDALIMVMGSRGCVWECSFCPLSKWEGRTLFHSPEYIVRQIEQYKATFDHRTFVFGDNTLTYPNRQIIEICELLVERKVDIEWICMTRADMVSRDVLEKMAAAGCREISYGIESLSQTVQKAIRKKLSVKRVPPAFELTHQAKITSCVMLMVGNQGETEETMRETAALASTLQPDRILINTTKVYPGTYLWDAALEEGVVGADYYETDPEQNPFDLAPDYTGENDASELRRLERLLQHRTTYVTVSNACQSPSGPRQLRSLQELEERFLMAAWRGEHTVLGGGEPLDHPELIELLNFGKERGVHDLALHTSARRLSRPLIGQLAATGMVKRLHVSLWALHEPHHDGRVGAPGALRETRKGLLGWTRQGGQATVLGFIDRWNVSSMHRWPEWLQEHGVDSLVWVFGQSPSGWDRVPSGDLPTLAEVAKELPRALDHARRLGLSMEVTGLPECVTRLDRDAAPPYELGRPFDEALDAEGQPVLLAPGRRAIKHFADGCEGCSVRVSCEGLWSDYLEIHGGAELRPPAEQRRRLAVVGA